MTEPQSADDLRERVAQAIADSHLLPVAADGFSVRAFSATSELAQTYADAALSVVAPLLAAGEPVDPCRSVAIHNQNCEHREAQVEHLVEALDDYQDQTKGDVSWAGLVSVALDALTEAPQGDPDRPAVPGV